MKGQSLLLFGGLLLATPAAVQAQFSYTVTTNQTVTITGYTGTDDVVVIPSTIDGLPVTSIGDDAFYGSFITGVTIPNSVTNIGDWAFEFCLLSSVTIPSNVTSIGEGPFWDCVSLTNIMGDPLNPAFSSVDGVLFNKSQTTLLQYPGGKLAGYMIPNSVTSIGDWAFAGCTSLASVTIPNSVTNIGDSAFEECYSLTTVTLGNGLATIGDFAFSYCTNLTSVTIPNSVTNIGLGAFQECYSLTTVTLGSGLTTIGIVAFSDCINLTSVTIPNSVTTIGDGAFQLCSGLTSVTLGSGLTTIGDTAFSGCTGLTNVTIPNSVTSIGDWAFAGCSNLTSLYFQGNAPGVGGPNAFYGDKATIYYLPGTVLWGVFAGRRPTALWRLPYPVILTSNPSFGVLTNKFGFTVSWATNLNVVVEAATDLANPVWSPVQTNTLTSGSFYFSDPQWKNYPARFYRVRSQ